MYKCLIWGTGIQFQQSIPLLKYYEAKELIKVTGITSNDDIYYVITGYEFIPKRALDQSILTYDRIIVMADGEVYRAICEEAVRIGFPDRCIVPYRVMGLIGFDFDIYEKLRSNTPSIIAPNCWGGITYNTLGLQFSSPFINMFLDDNDYMKFLYNPNYYMEQELELAFTKYNEEIRIEYPVVRLGDILLYCNHYKSFEEANNCWNRRKERINWNNLFVMMFERDSNFLDDFCSLPYDKKVFFSGNNLKRECTIPIKYTRNDGKFYDFVNRCGKGGIVLYDMFKLLYNGDVVLHSELHEVI